MSAPPPAGSATASSAAKSTGAWLNDLKGLFDHAKERFPDVVWEMLPEEAGSADEEVWGHKAMIYARAPPSFLAQYFDVRPNGASRIYSASPGQDLGPNPTQSTFSLAIVEQPTTSRTPSPSRAHLYSPSSSHPTNTLLRLTTAISPSLFSNQLEYIYTGKGIGAAFEFLFDSPEGIDGAVDVDATRIDKLRKDLVFMWRSRLYSDVKIALTGPFSPDSEEATAVFSSHRFILASRSPYFRALFLSGFASVTPTSSSGPITITLPSPPFTPASLHFTLGFIYAGTLNFSHRTFDLTTAFQIYRSAAYLSLTSLQSEIESRIVEEMTHGLFHAYLTFEEYEKVTGGRWGVGGSKCKQCTRRIPRILEFATSEDIKNAILDRGARRALVGLFGEGWVTPEFAALPPKSRATALKGVYARTTPQNLFPLLFAAESALAKVESPGIRDQPWADMLKDLIVQARKKMDDVLCSQCEDVFEQEEWLAILENDGVRFDDGDKVRWVMDSLRRGLGDTNAGIVYQTLVSSVLLRPHPTSASVHAATLLSSTSPIRSQVERARLDILRWLRKRWVGVRLANGFNSLDGWALKEISDELDVPVDDLLAPPPSKGGLTPQSSIESASSPRPNQDVDTASIASSQANAPPPNRSVAQTTVQNSAEAQRDPLASSRSSVASSVSVSSVRTAGTAQARARPSNPTSSPSVPRNPPPRTRVENTSPRPGNSSLTPPNGRPKSLAPSIASARSVSSARSGTSTTSTLGKARVSLAPKTPINLSAPSPLSRPHSRVSNSSDASTTFNTAPSTVSLRGRTTSAMSNASSSNAKGGGSRSQGLTVPIEVRPRRTSAASTTSVASSTLGSSKAAPPLPRKVDATIEKSKAAPRPSSTASARSAVSGTPERRKVPITTRTPLKHHAQPPPPSPVQIPVIDRTTKSAKSSGSLREPPIPDSAQRKSVTSLHTPHPSDASTIRAAPDLEHKPSSDTITKPGSAHSGASTVSGFVTPRASVAMSAQSYQTPSPTTSPPPPPPIQMQAMAPLQARGVTLNIGIPCMISSKRSRFKAFARYIGEVEGETGPWVGVEVPVGDGWSADKLDGRDWNDGSLRGVRYFDIGGSIDDGEERAARRQRLDLVPDSASSISSINGYQSSLNRRKREGELLHVEQERMKRLRSTSPAISDISSIESRGLFVRPQQILLVIDAQEQH